MHRYIWKRAGDLCVLGRWWKSLRSACFLPETWNRAGDSCILPFSVSAKSPDKACALLHTGTSLALITGGLFSNSRVLCWNLLPATQWIFVAFFKSISSHTCVQKLCLKMLRIYQNYLANFNSLPGSAHIFCVTIQSLIRPLQLQTRLRNESGLCGKRCRCQGISTPFLAGAGRWTVNEAGLCGNTKAKY